MGKIEQTLRAEISRLAGKEVRSVCGPLTRDVRELKRKVSRLAKTVDALEKLGGQWREQVVSEKAELKATEEEVEAARLSPGLIRKLRKRLGLSQSELAAVVGVSTLSVGHWEGGKTRPTGENRTALVALRKMGRREVRKVLELKQPEKKKATTKTAKKTKGRKTTTKQRKTKKSVETKQGKKK